MASVVNRTTKQYLGSVHTPDYPVGQWIINPDISSLTGVPSRYWIIAGDVISEMSQAQKDVVDAAIVDASRDSVAGQVDAVEDIVRALALSLLDELNNHADKINAILDAADGAANLGQFKSAMVAIVDYPQRTVGQLKSVMRSKLGS